MGVVLYKKGNTHKRNGLDVELKVFDSMNYESNLNAGWYLTAEEAHGLVKKTEVGTKEPEKDITTSTDDESGPDTLKGDESNYKEDEEPTEKKIREIAKKAGIKNFHNKGIPKIKAELEALAKK